MSSKAGTGLLTRRVSAPMSHNNTNVTNHLPTTPAVKNTVKETKNSTGTFSPRAPPLISKFRGEPPSPPHTTPQRSHTGNDGIFFASIGGSKPPPFYIIHPEWASEVEGILRLETRVHSMTPLRESERRPRGDILKGNDGEIRGGILPVDRGDESILTTARRANAHNPVWPHRCRSSPAQRSRNPIAWV
ncbi:unnamed protein product [Hymenolepis diminuta]|uniref:Uncharacterized protein n=2 Tax=Hymenolepis diminuta TaxID=6216 RepID=A0A564ZD74_HYMDI|nr:unnamed protein product [Hymenolepis diminuta]